METKKCSKGQSRLWEVGNGTGKYARPINGYTESKLVADMVTALKKAHLGKHLKVIKTHGGNFQRAGLPDLYIQLLCPIWIEVKLPGGDTSATQRKTLIELAKAGAYVATCETVEEFLATIEHAIFLDSKRCLYVAGESVHFDD